MKKTYLIAYNTLLFLGWGVFLIYQIVHGFQMDRFSLILLNICQISAVLEIIHAALKWVKTPVFTSAIQIFSRVFVLIFINLIPPEQQFTLLNISGVQLVTVAWGVTEIVRYSFYATSLVSKNIYALSFLRYTLFIVLYPTGVFGEWLILFSQMQINGFEISLFNAFLVVVVLAYFIFFPRLYMYMFQQRKKKL